MTYNVISSSVAIAELYRKLRLQGSEYLDNFVVWVGEALEHIGNGSNVVKKATVLKVEKHKTLLPCDLYYIEGVGYQKTDNNVFISNPNWDGYDNQTAFKAAFPTSQPLAYGSRIFNAAIHGKGAINEYAVSSDSYITDGTYIKTTFEEGYITLLYTAFATDEQGFPMIPKDISFQEAIFWYCFKWMLFGGYKHPEFTFEMADAKWQQYCTQARNAHNMLDIPMSEAFMNQWTRLIPNINAGKEWFNTLQDQENLIR